MAKGELVQNEEVTAGVSGHLKEENQTFAFAEAGGIAMSVEEKLEPVSGVAWLLNSSRNPSMRASDHGPNDRVVLKVVRSPDH